MTGILFGQVKRKMTEEEFIRNNRKINDGKDLPREMLTHLYHSIAKNGEHPAGDSGHDVLSAF